MARGWRPPRPIIDRIADSVALDDSGCLVWLGRIDRGGYPHMLVGSRVDGTRRTGALVHRLVLEAHGVAIPPGMQVDHLCRVRHCVRPDHLEVVTPRVNTLRSEGPSAINARKTHCPREHEYSPENTYISKAGGRFCRACNRLAVAKYNARKKAAS